jgi:hypothetical protein
VIEWTTNGHSHCLSRCGIANIAKGELIASITAASTSAAANPEVKAFEHDPIAKAVSISAGTEFVTLRTP